MTPQGLSDKAFVEAIESCTLPGAEFTHRNHVRLAWLYLQEMDAETAGRRIGDTILRYATSLGAAKKFDAGLTLRWMQTVERAVQVTPAADFETFIAAHPELLRRDLLSSTR